MWLLDLGVDGRVSVVALGLWVIGMIGLINGVVDGVAGIVGGPLGLKSLTWRWG